MAKAEDKNVNIFELHPNNGSSKKLNRVGRGNGSGNGKTCGKGQKGQKCRKGRTRPYVGFEGGQMPLTRRLPKRGFCNQKFAKVTKSITIDTLNKFKDGEEVTLETLKAKKLVRNKVQRVKIIAGGELKSKVNVKVYAVSKGAEEDLKKAGATVTLINATEQ